MDNGNLSINTSCQAYIHLGYCQYTRGHADILFLQVHFQRSFVEKDDEVSRLSAFLWVSLLCLVDILAIGDCSRSVGDGLFRYTVLSILEKGYYQKGSM